MYSKIDKFSTIYTHNKRPQQRTKRVNIRRKDEQKEGTSEINNN